MPTYARVFELHSFRSFSPCTLTPKWWGCRKIYCKSLSPNMNMKENQSRRRWRGEAVSTTTTTTTTTKTTTRTPKPDLVGMTDSPSFPCSLAELVMTLDIAAETDLGALLLHWTHTLFLSLFFSAAAGSSKRGRERERADQLIQKSKRGAKNDWLVGLPTRLASSSSSCSYYLYSYVATRIYS